MLIVFWFCLVWLCGWSALPLSRRVWKKTLPDAGLAAGRVLFLALWTLLAFWLGQGGVPVRIGALLVFPLLITGLVWLWRERGSLRSTLRANRRGILVSEIFFFVAFVFFLMLRGFWPDVSNGEKPMDMALISSLARAEYLPPANPYTAGVRLSSYYYFGHLEAALLTDATFSEPRLAYNLMCATLPSLIFSSLFSLCAALTVRLRHGILAALLILCCGTLEPLRERLPQIFGAPLDARPYFATSRVIPFTINEYPFFTFCFADLHAHFFAMPLAVLLMSLAWATWQCGVSTRRGVLCGAILGALLMTNTWDFPLYALLVLLCMWRRERLKKSLLAGLALVALSLAFSFPFWSRLHSGATQLHAVWPLQFAADAWLLIWFLWLSLWVLAVFKAKRQHEAPHEYSLAYRLALCGLLALLWIEIAWTGFLPPPFHRQDMVFKFGLQAWYLLGTAAACAAIRQNFWVRWPLPLRGLYFVLIPIALYSSVLTIFGRTHDFKQWQGWDAWNDLAPSERAAAGWLVENARDGDAIFEAEQAQGGDYTEYSRYAHATGVPGVIGPQGHSFQWLGDWDEVFSRKNATHAFYTSRDQRLENAILRKYRARWIILGELERREYGAKNIARLESRLPTAARFGNVNDSHRVVICHNPLRE